MAQKLWNSQNLPKLKLYDSSGVYITKTVHTVISCTLCTPVLLVLPFLKHINIVIDIEAQMVIDKVNNFDLLHPTELPVRKAQVEIQL